MVKSGSLNRLSCCIVRWIAIVNGWNKSVVEQSIDKHKSFLAMSLFLGINVSAKVDYDYLVVRSMKIVRSQ